MTLIDILKEQLTRHENKRNKPYKDSVGKWTVGVGRNIDDVPFSEDEIALMFFNDIRKAINDAKKFDWFNELDEVRQSVIVNMIFNMGYAGFCEFRKTIKHIVRKEYKEAAKEMLDSPWEKQTGGRAHELSKLMEIGKI